jgi:uridine phosphorylase
VPSRLRPTAPLASEAVLVGDPGRALLLAQELLEQPKMSNHARGLWGYSGRTPAGEELTIQSTGMGAPSAAIVLADLAKLGVRRAVRVGTCTAVVPEHGPGDLLVVEAALAAGGSAAAFGAEAGAAVEPDADLLQRLRRELPEAPAVTIASLDALHGDVAEAPPGAVALDLQTAALLARGRPLGIAVAALLIVSETAGGATLGPEPLEEASKTAGRAAAGAL